MMVVKFFTDNENLKLKKLYFCQLAKENLNIQLCQRDKFNSQNQVLWFDFKSLLIMRINARQ